MKKLFLYVLISFLIIGGGVGATIVYVDTDGSGDFNCDGTDDHVEINQALDYVANNVSFTTVHLNGPNTFWINSTIFMSGNTILQGDSDAEIKLIDNAGWGATQIPLIEMGNDGDGNFTIQGFIIDGNSENQGGLSTGVGWYNLMHAYNVYHVTVDNMRLEWGLGDGLKVKFYGVEHSGKSSFATFTNNSVYKLGHDAFYCLRTNNVTAAHNDIFTRCNSAIRFSDTGNAKAYNNTIHSEIAGWSTGPGLEIDKNDGYTQRNIEIYNNTFHTLQGSGIWITNEDDDDVIRGYDVHIHHNTFYNVGQCSFYYGRTNAAITLGQSNNTIIENNIIVNSGYSGIKYYNFDPYYKIQANFTTIVRNNIIINCDGQTTDPPGPGVGIWNYNDTRHTFISENNCIYNNTGGAYNGTNIIYSNDIYVDPLLANISAHDYHLKSQQGRWSGTAWVKDPVGVNSQCIDAGYPSSDYSNEPEPNGGRINIGRYGNTAEASMSAGSVATGTLVGEWHFDEGAGTIAYDSSGYGNNGTINGGAVWTSGKVGSTLEFDGIDDYVDVGNGASLNITDAITISAWVKSEVSSEMDIICKAAQTSYAGYEFGIKDGEMKFRINPNSSTWVNRWSVNAKISNSSWNHIAATYDGTNISFFKDGLLINSVLASGSLYSYTSTVKIGIYHFLNGYRFNGSIDEVKIYNKALSAEEILTYYQESIGTPPTITSSSPSTPVTQDEGTTNSFSVTTSQVVTSNWFLDSIQQGENSQTFTKTWSYTDSGTHNITYSGTNENGTVSKEWDITVNDVLLAPPLISLTSIAQDTTPPYYSATPIPRANFTTDVTANCRIATIDLAYDAMTNNCDDYGTTHSCLSPTIADGTHILYLACTDGTTAHTAVNNYEAQVIIDTTSPEIQINIPINNTEISGAITLTATATDANGVDIVEFYLIGMDLNGVDPITCAPSSGLIGTANKAGNIFTLAWTVSNCPGNHWIVVSAYDPAENYILNYSYVTIPSICAESWSCTEWSECSGGVQTRICTDANNCGTTINKPAEVAGCGINKRYFLQVTGKIECT